MIQVINRALNILEVIANNSDKELGLSEIADEVELNHGTCANILKTLVNRDYVEQVGTKKGYKLGYMSYQLTNAKSYYTDILSISKSLMDDLRDEINEMVILSIIKSGKRVLLYEAPCNHTLQIRTTQESSIYRATTGRMILAHYSPKELDDLIEKIGLPTEKEWPEVKSKSDLIQYLNQIKTNDVEITLNLNHVSLDMKSTTFILCILEHLHPARRKKRDIMSIIALHSINRRDLNSAQTGFSILLKIIRKILAVDSIAEPPPACIRMCLSLSYRPSLGERSKS